MSTYRVIVRIDAEETDVLRIGRVIKDALGDVEVFTYEEHAFLAFWKSTPPLLVRKAAFRCLAEHEGPRVNGHRKHG